MDKLTGKYAQLRDDIKKALSVGMNAEMKNPEDGGACNFDAAAISLPRWKEALVKRAVSEAGTRCFVWTLWGKRYFVIEPITRAQANARSRNAEGMSAALNSCGYDVFDYCQMD